MRDVLSGVNFIERMSTDEFYQKIVRSLARGIPFGTVVSFGVKNTSEQCKTALRGELENIGIPYGLLNSDEELDEIVKAIYCRAVRIK